MIKWLKGLFKSSDVLDAERVMKVADSWNFYISNGRSWYMGGGDKEMYENNRLRVHLGKVVSGYGDWGGGFDHASSGPVKVLIDEDLNILEIKFSDFYNSAWSKQIRKRCERSFGKREYRRLGVKPGSSLDVKLKEAFSSEEKNPFMIGFDKYEEAGHETPDTAVVEE